MNDTDVKDAISRDTRVTLGAAAACAITLLTGALWLNSRLTSFQMEVTSLQSRVSALQLLIEQAAEDRWTQTEMYLWTELLKARNPEVAVPEVPGLDNI